MVIEAKETLEKRDRYNTLARLIEYILYAEEPLGLEELATRFCYSPSHLTRMFHSETGESLGFFINRIAMERSAYRIRKGLPLLEVAHGGGFSSLAAFSRAFTKAHGLTPSEFRKVPEAPCALESPQNLHWFPDFLLSEEPSRSAFNSRIEYRPSNRYAVWRFVGNYSQLDKAWLELAKLHEANLPSSGFTTFYLDNMWTFPNRTGMRADLGWKLEERDACPSGLREVQTTTGKYAITDRYLLRKERNDGWTCMIKQWLRQRSGSEYGCIDEYESLPIPFQNCKTRVCLHLDSR